MKKIKYEKRINENYYFRETSEQENFWKMLSDQVMRGSPRFSEVVQEMKKENDLKKRQL